MVSTSSPSEKISSFSRGSRPCSLPPVDDLLAALDRRRAVGAEAGPVGHPVRRIAQEGGGAEGVRQHDQQIAAIIACSSPAAPGRARRAAPRRCRQAPHSTIGSSCALVPSASRSVSMASSTLEVPVKAAPMPSFSASHAPALPQEGVPPPRAEIGDAQVRQLLQPLDLVPHLGLGAGIEHVERRTGPCRASPRASATR